MAGALLAAFATSAIISALGGFVAVYVRSRMLQALLLIGAALADMGSGETGVAFVVAFLFTLLKLYIIWWVILKIIRHNLLAFFSAGRRALTFEHWNIPNRAAKYLSAKQRCDRPWRTRTTSIVAARGLAARNQRSYRGAHFFVTG